MPVGTNAMHSDVVANVLSHDTSSFLLDRRSKCLFRFLWTQTHAFATDSTSFSNNSARCWIAIVALCTQAVHLLGRFLVLSNDGATKQCDGRMELFGDFKLSSCQVSRPVAHVACASFAGRWHLFVRFSLSFPACGCVGHFVKSLQQNSTEIEMWDEPELVTLKICGRMS